MNEQDYNKKGPVLNRFTAVSAGVGFLGGVAVTLATVAVVLQSPRSAHEAFNKAAGRAYANDPNPALLEHANGVLSVPAARGETISYGYIGPKGAVKEATLTLVDKNGDVTSHKLGIGEKRTAGLEAPAPQ